MGTQRDIVHNVSLGVLHQIKLIHTNGQAEQGALAPNLAGLKWLETEQQS